MVYWFTSFRIATKDASSFLISAKRIIKEKCGFEWNVSTDVGQRITKIHFHAPTFGYRVDLQTPWEEIRRAEEQFNKLIEEARMALLDLAERYNAMVEVINSKEARYIEPRRLRQAEENEKKAVKIVCEALKQIEPLINGFEDVLTVDAVVEKAKKT